MHDELTAYELALATRMVATLLGRANRIELIGAVRRSVGTA
jgi:hypothetical protein